VKRSWNLAQPPSWRTTPCRLSATAYLKYSQLPSILESYPPSPTWGRAIPCWQGLTLSRHNTLYHWLQKAHIFWHACPGFVFT
jgi:hypothetical protein